MLPMKVLLFGATGMVGQGVLRECLLDPGVEGVTAVGRNPTGVAHPKLRDLVHSDLFDLSPIERELAGFDACFYCLGVSSVGLTEAAYCRVTRDLTVTVAETLVRLNPGMTFVFVSGAGSDSTEHGRTMWARVKGEAENVVLRLPFKAACVFRPGLIIPLHGIESKTALYRIPYAIARPLLPLLERLLPDYVTTTEKIGRAMVRVAREGRPKPILETADINALVRPSPAPPAQLPSR
jgi:uncharacterized protein YbjT (DUF2867 family)